MRNPCEIATFTLFSNQLIEYISFYAFFNSKGLKEKKHLQSYIGYILIADKMMIKSEMVFYKWSHYNWCVMMNCTAFDIQSNQFPSD